MKKSKKITFSLLAGSLALSAFLGGCSSKKQETVSIPTKPIMHTATPVSDAKNKVYYEIFVRSFADSNGDGIGDLKGVTEKLDYLKKLGVQGIWLMPINPSPSYHGYDVTDYEKINPDYGTMNDFKTLLSEAHKRGITVLMDLVLNHTSDQNPWFEEASSSPTSPMRNWYNWQKPSTDVNQISELGQPVWRGTDPNKYEGLFDSSMPDLNYDNPAVRNEVENIGKFWLEQGVDGFRLDAAKFLYAKNDAPDNNEKNVAFWQEFRKSMETVNKHVVMVGEVWDTASVIGPYLNNALTSAFDFDLSTDLINAVNTESDTGFASQLVNVRKFYAKQSNGQYVDSIFLTNHDMERVMSQLNDNVNHAKMAASILFTLPGDPFIYYGEETGMKGNKPDEHIREPFIWSKNAKENTSWETANFNPSIEPLNQQLKDPNSMYNFYKMMIQVRESSPVLVKGGIDDSDIQTDGAVSFYRTLGNKKMLVIHNLSKNKKIITLSKDDVSQSKIYFANKSVLSEGKVYMDPYSTIILFN